MESETAVHVSGVKKLKFSSPSTKIFIAVLSLALVAGIGTGYYLSASGNTKVGSQISLNQPVAKTAQQDSRTFRDFAEGKIAKKDTPKIGEAYSEGTHLLIREGAVPVALTSSVVDLSKYEGKSVKVYGETQKAVKEGWLMDVGRVDEK